MGVAARLFDGRQQSRAPLGQRARQLPWHGKEINKNNVAYGVCYAHACLTACPTTHTTTPNFAPCQESIPSRAMATPYMQPLPRQPARPHTVPLAAQPKQKRETKRSPSPFLPRTTMHAPPLLTNTLAQWSLHHGDRRAWASPRWPLPPTGRRSTRRGKQRRRDTLLHPTRA